MAATALAQPASRLQAAGAAAAQSAPDRAPLPLVTFWPTVLRVHARRADGSVAAGSGVAIAPDRVATNCHVSGAALAVQVMRGDQRFVASRQAADGELDVCVLEVPGLGAEPAQVGDSRLTEPGQHVQAVGFPGGFGLRRTEGELVQVHPWRGGRVLQTSAAFASGASGGGLFDVQGRLLGLLTFRAMGVRHAQHAVPVEWVQQVAAQPAARWRELDGEPPAQALPAPFWAWPAGRRPDFLGGD